MISVVIPTFNNESTLAVALAALVPAAVDGIVREVIIADGGSRDATIKIADVTGADVVSAPAERAAQLAAGAQAAKSRWLLFLPPAGVLSDGWEREAAAHMAHGAHHDGTLATAGRFERCLEGAGLRSRAAVGATRAAHAALGLGVGGGGLLIARSHYVAAGGFQPASDLEDVDLMRRIGRRRIVTLRSRLVVGSGDGPIANGASLSQIGRLVLYRINVPVRRLAHLARIAGERSAAR